MYTSMFFFFNDTATTEIYTLSLHDALPILQQQARRGGRDGEREGAAAVRHRRHPHEPDRRLRRRPRRSEEHTSELQSRQYLVCRLLLEKKNHTSDSSIPLCCSSPSYLVHEL